MIKAEKVGAEFADKLAEIKRLEDSEEVRTARAADLALRRLDERLRELRALEREGAMLIYQGIDLNALRNMPGEQKWQE